MEYFAMLQYFLSGLYVFCDNHYLFGYSIFSIFSGALVLRFVIKKVGDLNA